MNAPTVYLAGPITGLSWGGTTDWRDYVSKELVSVGIISFSPLRGKDYLANETSIGDSYEQHTMSSQRGIFARDFHDATTRDLLFVNLLDTQRVSIGTVMEIAWANCSRVPIVLAMTEKNSDGSKNMHDHSMLREACPLIVPTLEEAVHITKRLLLPWAFDPK